MSDTSDDEDSISKIDFSVISMAIEAGGKMVQQILNCIHYGTPEVRNLMYNECDFVVECRVCRNLFRSIPNFVAHKRIYCTAEAEQTPPSLSNDQEDIVVVQPTDVSPGPSSASVSPTGPSIAVSSSLSVVPTSSVTTTKPAGMSAVKSFTTVTSSMVTSATSQITSRTTPNLATGSRTSATTQNISNTVMQKASLNSTGQQQSQNDKSENVEEMSTLKQLLTGQFKGKSSEYSFYTKTAEKMEKERRAKEISTVTMTPIPTNQNAAYMTVTRGSAETLSHGSAYPVRRPVIGQNSENTQNTERNKELQGKEIPQGNSKRISTMSSRVLNEPSSSSKNSPSQTSMSSVLKKQKLMEQKNRKYVELRPVHSQLGSRQYSELSELGLLGHCDMSHSKCLLCSVTYSSRKSLLQHMHSIHSGRKMRYPCSLCDKKFSYFWGLTRHLQNNHNKTKVQIDKMREKLKALAFESVDSDEEDDHKKGDQRQERDTVGQRSQGSSSDHPVVKETPNVVQKGFVPRISGGGGIKLNKCEGCGKAFWKNSSYVEHVRQCKWLSPSTVISKTDKSSLRSSENSTKTTEKGNTVKQANPTFNTTVSTSRGPATRSKVIESDCTEVPDATVKERISRSCTKSKNESKDSIENNVKQAPDSEENTGSKEMETETVVNVSTGKERDKNKHIDESRSKTSTPDSGKEERTPEKKSTSTTSSPGKMSSASSSPGSPPKQVVTRHAAKTSEKELQYMRTRFFDKRRESHAKPEKSPQSKIGPKIGTAIPAEKDAVKMALDFNKTPHSNKGEKLGSNSTGKSNTSPEKGNESLEGCKSSASESEKDIQVISISKDCNHKPPSTDDLKDDGDSSSRESSRDRNSVRTRRRLTSVQKTEDNSDRSRSRESTKSSPDNQKVSRDNSRESLKDRSPIQTRTRASSVQRTDENSNQRSRSREVLRPSSPCRKTDGRKSPVEQDSHSRDSSKEGSSSRLRQRSSIAGQEIDGKKHDGHVSTSVQAPAKISDKIIDTKVMEDSVESRQTLRKSSRKVLKTSDKDGGNKSNVDISKEESALVVAKETTASPDIAKQEKNTNSIKEQGNTSAEGYCLRNVSRQKADVSNSLDSVSDKRLDVKNTNYEQVGSETLAQRQSDRVAARKLNKEDKTVDAKSSENVSHVPSQKESLRTRTRQSLPNVVEQDTAKKLVQSNRKSVPKSDAEDEKKKDGTGLHLAKQGSSKSTLESETSEQQKRSSRIREKVTKKQEDSADSIESQQINTSSDEVDGINTNYVTRSTHQTRVQKTRDTEDCPLITQGMIITSSQPEEQNFLGLEVSPHIRRTSPRTSASFVPRIPKHLESTYSLKTMGGQSSRPDSVSKKPESEIQVIEEIWVQKEPGQPTEEIRTNKIVVTKPKDTTGSQPFLKKPTSTHTSTRATRSSDKLRSYRSQLYVTDPKTTGTSEESTQTKCLDLNRIASLSDEKGMKCLQCGLEFSCLSNLRRHVVRHLGWRRYKCKLCKFSSYNKSECNTHLIRSHNTKARNSTASTLIIDLNKEASRVRSQKKWNTMKSKLVGPSLRSRKKEEALPRRTKAEILMSITEHSDSEIVRPVALKGMKAKCDNTEKESRSEESNVSQTLSDIDNSVMSKRLRKRKKEDTDDSSQVTKKIVEENETREDLNIDPEDLGRKRKRKRSSSDCETTSKGETTRMEAGIDDTRRTRRRKRSHSGDAGEVCSKEEDKDAMDKSEALSVQIKPKRVLKRSTSLDASGFQVDNNESFSDSWDIPSVSDYENSDNETASSPPSAKITPNLETMMAALEEAKAFKFVRQRGKGRRSFPMIKKTQRSGSIGSHTDSGVSGTNNEQGEVSNDPQEKEGDSLDTNVKCEIKGSLDEDDRGDDIEKIIGDKSDGTASACTTEESTSLKTSSSSVNESALSINEGSSDVDDKMSSENRSLSSVKNANISSGAGDLVSLKATGNSCSVDDTNNSSGVKATDNSSSVDTTGNSSSADNTGNSSSADNTGNSSGSDNTGNSSSADNTGNSSGSDNTGNSSSADNTGNSSSADNTGNSSSADTTGNSSSADNTGNSSSADNTGNSSTTKATVNLSSADNTGNLSSEENAKISSLDEGNSSSSTGLKDTVEVCKEIKDQIPLFKESDNNNEKADDVPSSAACGSTVEIAEMDSETQKSVGK